MAERRYQPIVEASLLLVATFALVVVLRLPTLWFLGPFAVIVFTGRSSATYGLTLGHPGSLGLHAAVVVAVYVPYVLGHYALASWWLGQRFRFSLPPGLTEYALDQVLTVALPEEFFFRGYVQTQCDRVWGKPCDLWGAKCGVGVPLAAVLFTACRVLRGGPVWLSTLFPGLLYGWLRARTNTIVVPTLYHAASAVLMQVMLQSFGG